LQQKPSKKTHEQEVFVRVKRITRDGDYWPAYQAEQITVIDNEVVERNLIDKPNTKQMAFAKAQEFIDDTE
jgi:hypothetical protein